MLSIETLRATSPRTRALVLVGLGVACLAVLVVIPPIRQGPRYYVFPDERAFFGIPSFWNVVSNLPFAVVGVIGLAAWRRQPAELRAPWIALFTGIFLTAFGSAYYHLAPSAGRLLFDRLPMTIAFASVFALALADRIDPRLGTRLLGPFLLIAAGSALFWYVTGDLRPYAFVQGYPIFAIPILLLLYPGRHLDGSKFAIAVGLYVVAKVLERYDDEIYAALDHAINGHALKHLAAAAACWWLYRMTPSSRTAIDE